MDQEQLVSVTAYFVYMVWTLALVGGGVWGAHHIWLLESQQAHPSRLERSLCAMASVSLVTWDAFTFVFVVADVSAPAAIAALLGPNWELYWITSWRMLAGVNGLMFAVMMVLSWRASNLGLDLQTNRWRLVLTVGIGMSLFVASVILLGGCALSRLPT